jgi:hypothetical protein
MGFLRLSFARQSQDVLVVPSGEIRISSLWRFGCAAGSAFGLVGHGILGPSFPL